MLCRAALAICVSLAASTADAATVANSVISLDGDELAACRRPEERRRRREVVRSASARRQDGEGSRADSGRVSRLRRRGMVLARRRCAGQSARGRPLSAAILGRRLCGRRLGQRHARRPSRRRAGEVHVRRDGGDQAGRRQPHRRSRVVAVQRTDRRLHPRQTPHGAFVAFNIGGIVDSVELLVTPQVRMDDLFVRADPKTGKIRVEADGLQRIEERRARLRSNSRWRRPPAARRSARSTLDQELKPGVNTISTEMQLANPRLWQLNDPFLYRMTGRIVGRRLEIGRARPRRDSASAIFASRTATSGSTAAACSGGARTPARTIPVSIRLPLRSRSPAARPADPEDDGLQRRPVHFDACRRAISSKCATRSA